MQLTTLLLLSSPVWAGWNLVFYSDTGCSGEILGHEHIATSEDSTCRRATALPEGVRSARYADSSSDDSFMFVDGARHRVRFYDSDDCSHHCAHRHALPERRYRSCVNFPADVDSARTVRSFNVVEESSGSGRTEGVLADGYCTFGHGDSLFYNGRKWRMHQVAAAYYHEIPAEEWNDDLHVANTTHRAAEHGDVDIYARNKLWQQEEDYLSEVALESWNVTKHVKRGKRSYMAERYNYAVESLCMDATTIVTDGELDALTKEVPNWNVACSGKSFAEWRAMRNKQYGQSEGIAEGVEQIEWTTTKFGEVIQDPFG